MSFHFDGLQFKTGSLLLHVFCLNLRFLEQLLGSCIALKNFQTHRYDGHDAVEQRLFINSIPAEAKRFAHAVRGHWGVENRLHWRLDVVLREDASRIRKGDAPAILTSIRHLCMNLFEQEPSNLRLAQKRRKAAWDDDYRAKVIFG